MRFQLPWRRSEKREVVYMDSVGALLLRAQGGGSSGALPTATAALEACVGIVGRAFASAAIDGPPAITPAFLSMVVRDLLRRGESVFQIDVVGGEVKLYPASGFDIDGSSPDPATWAYRIDLAAPTGNPTVKLGAESVLHFKYAVEPARPWRGLGPLQVASIAGKMASEVAQALAGRGERPPRRFFASPIAELRRGFYPRRPTGRRKGLQGSAPHGRKHVVGLGRSRCERAPRLAGETVRGFASGRAGRTPRASVRRGREISPLGRLVSAELTAKLERPISISWKALMATDIQGRARAYKALVDAGMDAAEAKGLAGLE